MIPIKKELISINFTKGFVIKPKFIIIHETDNFQKGADAENNRDFFANHKEAEASAHFTVDEHSIVQCLELNQRGWHIGVIYGHPVNNPLATNDNAIGIEICVNADGNYEQARANAVDLAKYLMGVCGIPAGNVIRHYDACMKHCPRKMLDTPSLWIDFKNRLVQTASVIQPSAVNPAIYIVSKGDTMGNIASKFNTTVETLTELNGLYDPNTLSIGQIIKIAKKICRVQKGDTLSIIANVSKVDIFTLTKLNGLKNVDDIKVGQILILA